MSMSYTRMFRRVSPGCARLTELAMQGDDLPTFSALRSRSAALDNRFAARDSAPRFPAPEPTTQ